MNWRSTLLQKVHQMTPPRLKNDDFTVLSNIDLPVVAVPQTDRVDTADSSEHDRPHSQRGKCPVTNGSGGHSVSTLDVDLHCVVSNTLDRTGKQLTPAVCIDTLATQDRTEEAGCTADLMHSMCIVDLAQFSFEDQDIGSNRSIRAVLQ